MEGYVLLAIVIVGLFIALMITRKELSAGTGFTKKGIMKLLALLIVIFLIIVIAVFVNPNSWR